MIKDILPLYTKYKNCQNAYIVGCGPGAKKFDRELFCSWKNVIIALNRGIEFTKEKTDILFIDHPFSLAAVKKYIVESQLIAQPMSIVLPVWSKPPGQFNFNIPICVEFDKQLYYYLWGYLNDRLLDKSANYPLDMIQLYIGWGISNSAAHFVTRLPNMRKITLYGCDGKPNPYVKEQCKTDKAQQRRLKQYKLSKEHLDKILIKSGIEYEYI